MTEWKPLGSKVVIKKEPTSGFNTFLVLPDVVKEQYYKNIATVIDVGPGEILENGEREPIGVKPGDKVIIWPGYNSNPLNEAEHVYVVDITEIEGTISDD